MDFETIPAGRLQRCRINLERRTAESTVLEERCCEFATVNPRRQGLDARYGWMAVAERERGNDPLQAIEKWICAAANGGCGARRRGAS